ncbi:MAG: hypothetical protein M5U26_17665 [Planctomycetota bacterium]|nr:hypothetical protein [Planctomycetota bacterium]
MYVYFTTIVRGAPNRDAGELVQVDWERKRVARTTRMILENPYFEDPNPRGNTRGGRGIAFHDGQVVAGTHHELKFFDAELKETRSITHNLLVGTHEVLIQRPGRIWIVATSVDLLLELDLATGEAVNRIWPRDLPGLQKALGLEPLEIDRNADNRVKFGQMNHYKIPHHLHMNAMAVWNEEVYGLLSNYGVLANFSREEVVIQDERLRRSHNLCVREDGQAFICDTYGRGVWYVDLNARKIVDRLDLKSFPWVRKMARWPELLHLGNRILKKIGLRKFTLARPLFVRGMDLSGDHLFIGLAPASILRIDWKKKELVDAFQYTTDLRHSVHSLKADPRP